MRLIDDMDEPELRWQLANLGVAAKPGASPSDLRALLRKVGWTYHVNTDASHKRFGDSFYFKLGDKTSTYKRPAVSENGLGLACFDVRAQLVDFGVPAAAVAAATNEKCLADLAAIGWRQYRYHKQGEANFGRAFYFHEERNASQYGRPEVGDNGMDIARREAPGDPRTQEARRDGDGPFTRPAHPVAAMLKAHHRFSDAASAASPQGRDRLTPSGGALAQKRGALPDSDEDLDVGLLIAPRAGAADFGTLVYTENQQLHKKVARLSGAIQLARGEADLAELRCKQLRLELSNAHAELDQLKRDRGALSAHADALAARGALTVGMYRRAVLALAVALLAVCWMWWSGPVW